MSDCEAAIAGGRAFADAADVAETEVARLQQRYGQLPAEPLLRAMIKNEFPGRVAVVSSFGAESALILALVAEIDPATPVIFLDTGKHFSDTLSYRDRLTSYLGLTDVRSVQPLPAEVAATDANGRLWDRNADACCHLRKVVPLERALAGFEAWITGRKRFQSGQRADLDTIEAVDSRIKINPLAKWSLAQVASEFKARGLPRHPLVAQGYPSIGCARARRKWQTMPRHAPGRWVGADKTECGIHRAKWARSDPNWPQGPVGAE
ncbi:MAG: phosphoadenylyl-sulfate reductase [Rhodospirillales bacterium]|nr:phosphoadenylyl-sulfate reductase [Rhodospirillales bacterium]